MGEVKSDNTYATLNYLLVYLFNEIMELEGSSIITKEFDDITNNDMHIIEAVGEYESRNMTAIANRMRITVGSLTTSMNNLVRKGYVVRERSEDDRRVVNILLTEKGRKAYNHHKDFHIQMIEAVIKNLDEKEIPILVRALDSLVVFFKEYPHINE